MNRRLPLFLLLSASSLTACLGNIDLKPGSYRPLPEGVEISPEGTLLAQGQVVGISDGDTLSVLGKDKKTYRIRLQGIDAPEKKQDYGQKCKESLMRLTANLPVEVEAYKQDRYGRIVAKVTARGKDVALEQIRNGCGWHYTAYAGEQSTSDRKDYAAAEKAARQARRGLWRGKNPQAPWDYRHQP
ncbi:MAG: thermonuclease family protein [Thiolinea sp.]